MSQHRHYTPAALDRIRSLGEREFLSFLDEVSSGAATFLAGLLPRVKGFRRNSRPGIQQGKRMLWRKVASPTAADRDRVESALYSFWRTWADERLGDAKATHALLEALDSDEHATPQPVLDLFAALKDRSLANGCSREMIERFFTFSPFDESAEVRGLIDASKPTADIDRELAIKELPERLSQSQREIQSLEARLRALLDQVEASGEELHQLHNDVTSVASDATRALKGNEELRSALDSQSDLARASGLEVVASNKALAARHDALDRRLSQLSDRVDSVTELVASHDADKSLDDWRATADGRLQALEAIASSWLPDEPAAGRSSSDSVPEAIRARIFGIGSGDVQSPFSSTADVVAAIAKNLEAIGLKKSAAWVFSREVCGAALIGKVVFLKGSRATEVVRLCARTLGGGRSVRISVPVGLLDAETVPDATHRALARTNPSTFVPAVAIEGVNRSALDIIGDGLVDLVTGDVPGWGVSAGPALVFASLTTGVGSLPIAPQYLELGPIFDVDHLDWRLRPSTRTALVGGTLPATVLATIRSQLANTDVDADEPLRLLRKFLRARNARLESAVATAYAALEVVHRGEKGPSTLQSIALGWLLPLCSALQIHRAEVDDELNGGKCDIDVPDPRIESIIQRGDLASDETTRS